MTTEPATSLPVFVRGGDSTPEVERIVTSLGGPAAAGLHRSIYVTRANQTVVVVTARDTPLAIELRAAGWSEPHDPPKG